MKTQNKISVLVLCLIMVITPIVSMTSCAIDTDCTHYSGTWVETKKPTCTEDGVHERICDDCGASEKAIIPPQGHNWTEATCYTPKTCKACSITEGEPLTHEDKDSNNICDFCDEEVTTSCNHCDDDSNGQCDKCGEKTEPDGEDEVINYPWTTQTLIFEMTHNTNHNELPSACERYLAGENDAVSENIDNKVRQRNMNAELITNVDVRYEYCPDTSDYSWGKNISRIEATVRSHSTKDSPDIYCNFVYDLVGAALRYSLANLHTTSRGTGDLSGLNYFEFTKEDYDDSVDSKGYMYGYMSSLSLSKNKMYVLASDYFTDIVRSFFVVPVNATLLSEVGMQITGDRDENGKFDIDDFYEQVKAGEWTYSLLAQYSNAIHTAYSPNATEASTLYDDAVGFAFSNTGLAATGLIYTTSVTFIHKEWDEKTNDWKYYYPSDNSDLYEFCDATTELFQNPGICIVGSKGFDTAWGDTTHEAIRTRFSQNHVLFGDITLLGALEYQEYQTLKETKGLGVVPVPVYKAGEKYMTQIHNVARAGAISLVSTKFVECSAFLNYLSTHSADILNEYYNYNIQYDIADGSRGTVYMLQYIRNNVRSSFDLCWDYAITNKSQYTPIYMWHSIMLNQDFQIDISQHYGSIYPDKYAKLIELVQLFTALPK